MTDILISILNMSAAASVAAVAVFLTRLLLKKVPKVFSYALWSVVFIRLVCPISFESPASLMPVSAEIIPHKVAFDPVLRIESDTAVTGESMPAASQFSENPAPQVNPVTIAGPVRIALYIGTIIWLLGAAVLLIYAVVGYIRLKQQVYDATIESGNVYKTDKISTAFVLGIVRPKIYIPLAISGTQLTHILRHEGVHIKRCDYLIKPLAFIVLALHWFNPVVWVSYYLMSKDMEMSCDEAVLRSSTGDLRQDYSMSLVNLYTGRKVLLSPLAFGEGSYKDMKERINNVMNFKKAPRWIIVVCLLVLSVFVLGFATNRQKDLITDVSASVIEESKESPVEAMNVNWTSPLVIYGGGTQSAEKEMIVTNIGRHPITSYEIALLAYDKNGAPVSERLHIQAVDYAQYIKRLQEKEARQIENQIEKLNTEIEHEKASDNKDQMLISSLESAVLEWQQSLERMTYDEQKPTLTALLPGHKISLEYPSVQENEYYIACVKQIGFQDNSVWENPEYDEWLEKYEGKKHERMLLFTA